MLTIFRPLPLTQYTYNQISIIHTTAQSIFFHMHKHLVTQVEKLKSSQVLHVVAASKEDDIRLSSSLRPLATAITMKLILWFCSLYVVYTEWHRPLFGVHSNMIEKLAQAGKGGGGGGGGCTPTPFYSIYHHVQSCSVRPSWEGRYTHPSSYLPHCILCVRC